MPKRLLLGEKVRYKQIVQGGRFMVLQPCPCMEGREEGLKATGLLYIDFPPYVYSDCPSYLPLRALNWIREGLQASCYHFQLNGSSELLLCHDLSLWGQLPYTTLFLHETCSTFFPVDTCVQLDFTLDKLRIVPCVLSLFFDLR